MKAIKKHWYRLAWAVYLIGFIVIFRPWEGGVNALIGGAVMMAVMFAIMAIAWFSERFAKKHGIGEARFDSDTGRLIEDDK